MVFAGAALVIAPWSFGLNREVAAFGSLAFAFVSFLIALLPRHYSAVHTDGPQFTLHSLSRLVRFPLFWIGGAFILLQLIGTQNPSWFRESTGYAWRMTPLPSVEWLPTNVETISKGFQGWRMIAGYAAAWLLVSALWIGITRRRSLQILCWIVITNALALAAVGAAHRLLDMSDHIVLWTRKVPHATAYGAFVYRNHAGAYLSLAVATTFALALWTHFDGRRRFALSTPAGVWGFGGMLLVVAVVFTYARSSVALLLLFVGLTAFGYLMLRLRERGHGNVLEAVSAVLLVLLLATCTFVVNRLDYSRLENRFVSFQRDGANELSYKSRVEARSRALEMLDDHWQRGTGVGSFQFLFHRYVRNDPFLTRNGRFYWEHAHIDWLEIPIEQGVAGTALLAMAFFWWLWRWFKNGGWAHPFALIIFLGALQTLLHAAVDFPFQHPAILVTWWALLIVALRWTEVEPVIASERAR